MGTNTNPQFTKKLSKLGTHSKLNHKKRMFKKNAMRLNLWELMQIHSLQKNF
ncbi:hypothetical protein LEP1GSC021_2230 [Leptospira noguchii str. 1993005606]|uniref:Uncharacterized protein n=1 Tax=Leptospira noguchii str. 2007001578 TaxID=1049974 RepID=A0ABP2TF92_9LEPT|nr:hypothetical protein LEP1GSC035_2682 [Leptospira noguchii str. 2007001578]EPE84093.1 hypothetical protein LEP1GSC021_2230 [Leptospira noguchii str. 1993005606]